MRDVGRTKSAGKAKERVMQERVSMNAKEEKSDAKENNTRRRRGETKTTEKDTNWAEWRLTWGPVAHTPRPYQTQRKKKRERPEG